MEIKLGSTVRDKVSGFQGTAESRFEYLSGTVQYGVQAKVKEDGTLPDLMAFDVQRLEVLDEGITFEEVADAKEIPLGHKARDIVTGYEGTVTTRVDMINGCVQYGLKRPVGPDGKMPEAAFIDSQQLEELDEEPVTVVSRPGGSTRLPKNLR